MEGGSYMLPLRGSIDGSYLLPLSGCIDGRGKGVATCCH